MATITVNGAMLSFQEAGEGDPPFVFIHGGLCDNRAWLPQFEDLSRDYRCLLVDLRGRGDSGAVPPYHVHQQAEDIAALLDAMALRPAILVGHNLGGLTALLVNELAPAAVVGIVAVDSPIAPAFPKAEAMRLAILAEGSAEPIRESVASMLAAGQATPEVRSLVEEMMLGCPAEVAAGMIEGLEALGPRMLDLVREADRKPFMAIWPDQSPRGLPGWLRDNTMFARQEPVSGTGHFLQLEEPAVVSALLRAFVDDVLRDPRITR